MWNLLDTCSLFLVCHPSLARGSAKIHWSVFFGLQRQRGGVNDNPNADGFLKNTQAIRVVKSVAQAPKRGNCRGSKLDTAMDKENINEPLPKRRRKKK